MGGGEALFRVEALEQPGPCQGPVPLHTGVGYTERLGRFRDGQAPEIPQLYNLQGLVQGEFLLQAASLGAPPASRVVHEDLPHHLGCNSQEVRSVLPAHPTLSSQAQIGFVDERRALKGVVEAFFSKIPLRQAPQLFVENGSCLVESLGVALGPIPEERGHRFLQRCRHRWSRRRLRLISVVYSLGTGLSMRGETAEKGFEGVFLQLTLLRAAGAVPGGDPRAGRLPLETATGVTWREK